jgi:RimJ/RimL family protein N-acetyltransferase
METQFLKIKTARLELVAATLELAQAELTSRLVFSETLNARVPESWPPPLNDADSMNWFRLYLKENPDAVGWSMWYFLLRDDATGERAAIGNGGFKGKPSPDGTVEIGYSIIESYQRFGYCSEAAQALVSWAFSHQAVTRVIAETYPELRGSIRVLEKNGFKHVGSGTEERTIMFENRREDFERGKATLAD